MRELVLGGEGLIGSELVEMLDGRGHEAISLDIKSGCDLRNAGAEPFENCDRVWFLAWDTGGAKYIGAPDKQHQMFKHNCELSSRVFDILSRTKKPFLFVTSQLAGQPNAYGMTKLMAERWAGQLGGKIARLWNTYGWESPDARSHVITDCVLSALETGTIRLMTNGRERRRFIYKSDCVAALVRIFDGQLDYADIAGGEWLTIRQVAEEVSSQLGAIVEMGTSDGEELIVDPMNPPPDWTPAVSFADGVAKVIADARRFLNKEEKEDSRPTVMRSGFTQPHAAD